jgi:hypothetical protein
MCCRRNSWNMDTQLMLTAKATCGSACKRPSGGNVLVFLAQVWFSPMTITDCTQHRAFTTCRKILGRKWTFLHSVQIWHPASLICFPAWRNMRQDIVSPVVKWSNVLPPCSWCNMNTLVTLCDKCFEHQGDNVEKYCTSDSFSVYCQFPLLKSCLWYICIM